MVLVAASEGSMVVMSAAVLSSLARTTRPREAVYQFSTNFNSYTGSMSTMTPWNLIAAVNILSMLPIIILYSFGQKYFIEGISLGSVKG